LKRSLPAAFLLLATACVILIDAVVVVVPQAMADPKPSATSPAGTVVAAASATADPAASPESPSITLVAPTVASARATPAPSAKPSAKPTVKPAAKTTVTPKARATARTSYPDTIRGARQYVRNRIGASGYYCINKIWTGESRWNPRAGNPRKAYGIPQAYPGSKMASFGSNWLTSPLTQVKWGLDYVARVYGSACRAYSFWKAHGWY
jgi:hypothetical protein